MRVLAIALRSLGVLLGAFVLLFSVGFFETGSPGFGVFSVLLGGSLAAFSILFRSSLTAHGREKAAERARMKEEQRAARAAAAEEKRRRQQEIRRAEQAAWHARVEQRKAEEARRAKEQQAARAAQAEEDFWRERARQMQEDALRTERRASERSPHDAYWVQSPYQSKRQRERELRDERRADARAQGVACCPYCGSTSLAANKKGYGMGKGALGFSVIGPLGLAAGSIGRQKVLVTCLNCGKRFKPGKGRV